ncbi:hypothetical protein VNO77_18844 [Canavalia gladiata]|uniref:Uncharacterized protein n=1 Tax=Canavalia gladiata TaxID=3824 RepID=A0AAN9QKR4_CANGL
MDISAEEGCNSAGLFYKLCGRVDRRDSTASSNDKDILLREKMVLEGFLYFFVSPLSGTMVLLCSHEDAPLADLLQELLDTFAQWFVDLSEALVLDRGGT